MTHESERPLGEVSTAALVGDLTRKFSLLVRKEVELAKAEIRTDLRNEILMASGLGAAGICALLAVQMLLLAVVFAFSPSAVMATTLTRRSVGCGWRTT